MPRGGRLPDRLAADVLERLSRSLAAGIDIRRAWAGETARVPARWRSAFAAAARSLAAGGGLAATLEATGAFGPLVTAVVAVGERTGRDAEVLGDVAATVREAARARGELRAGLVRPAFQLLAAVAAIGVLVVVSGSIADLDGRPVDILGLGLVGLPGLRRFLAIVAAVTVTAAVGMAAAARSWRDGGAVRRLAVRVPVLGPAVEASTAAAWCRAAALANHAGLDAGGLVALASAAAPAFCIPADAVVGRLRAGADLAEALREVSGGRLPERVTQAVGVGELTGTTAETLGRLADQLADEARAGFTAAVRAAGTLAWAAVAGVATLVVVRFFSFYAGLIQDATRPL